MRSICLGLAILIGSVLGASAQVTITPQVGGQGGGPFDDPCHPGDVLIGYDTTAGKSLGTIVGVCQAQSNGTLVGASYSLHVHGEYSTGDDFRAGDSPRCPAGQAIFGMTIWVNKFNEIDSVAATCVPLLGPPGASSQLERNARNGGVAVSESAIGCGLGNVAVAIAGRSGALVDSLGLKCSQAIADVPPPTNIVKVIGAGDVYDRPNPGNVPPIYPDGLDPAAPKNIVLVYLLEVGKDENVNWYRVNWNGAPAQPLWVFNGPGNFPFDAGSLATATATVNGGH